jgi:hypothetical protein
MRERAREAREESDRPLWTPRSSSLVMSLVSLVPRGLRRGRRGSAPAVDVPPPPPVDHKKAAARRNSAPACMQAPARRPQCAIPTSLPIDCASALPAWRTILPRGHVADAPTNSLSSAQSAWGPSTRQRAASACTTFATSACSPRNASRATTAACVDHHRGRTPQLSEAFFALMRLTDHHAGVCVCVHADGRVSALSTEPRFHLKGPAVRPHGLARRRRARAGS